MSACGEGPDQRSFAERARKLLKESLKDNYKDYFEFHELWARYNIGVGFQHENRLRSAVREYNYIINCWASKSTKGGDWDKYSNYLKGQDLLLLPAIIARAAIQIKLQLASHTLKTLSQTKWDRLGIKFINYLGAKRNYLRAEAYRLLDEKAKAEKCLIDAAKFVLGQGKLTASNYLGLLSKAKKYRNIKDRTIDTATALAVDKLRQYSVSMSGNVNDTSYYKHLYNLNYYFTPYWKAARISQTNRGGYLHLVAETLSIASKRKTQGSKEDLFLSKFYKDNRKSLLEDHESNRGVKCPICGDKSIDLRRLPAWKYDDFIDCLISFYNSDVGKSIPSVKRGQRIF